MTAPAAPRTSEMPREWQTRYYAVGSRAVWDYGPNAPMFFDVGIAGWDYGTELERRRQVNAHWKIVPAGSIQRFDTWEAAVAWAQETDQ